MSNLTKFVYLCGTTLLSVLAPKSAANFWSQKHVTLVLCKTRLLFDVSAVLCVYAVFRGSSSLARGTTHYPTGPSPNLCRQCGATDDPGRPCPLCPVCVSGRCVTPRTVSGVFDRGWWIVSAQRVTFFRGSSYRVQVGWPPLPASLDRDRDQTAVGDDRLRPPHADLSL